MLAPYTVKEEEEENDERILTGIKDIPKQPSGIVIKHTYRKPSRRHVHCNGKYRDKNAIFLTKMSIRYSGQRRSMMMIKI